MNKGRYKEKRSYLGSLKKKTLLLLAAGVALSAAKTMGKQWNILGELSKEWKKINRSSLKRSLISLYSAKLIDLNPKKDHYEIVLSLDGKKTAERFNLENLQIKKVKWDGKWRVILFDVPEKLKKVRNAIRFHLNDIGLIEYQKSVYISPYPCEREVKFIAEFYQAHKFIRFMVADVVDDEERYIKNFGLI